MILSIVCLISASLVAATPLVRDAPTLATSKGFKLVLNLTDPSQDFQPSIQNTYVVGIHTGAGFSRAGSGTGDEGSVFYQNGTTAQFNNDEATVVTDIGQPLSPASMSFSTNEATPINDINIDVGEGTPGIQLTPSSTPLSYLNPQTYFACNTTLAYYGGQAFITIEQSSEPLKNFNIPFKCVQITLVPECHQLEALPAGSYSSHKYALDSRCYNDVASISW